MNVVAIDTVGPVIGVALLVESGVTLRYERITRGAETRLIPWVLELTDGDLSILDGVIVAPGPGAFTGVRVGLSTAEGLAFSLRIPLVGVSPLQSRGERASADIALLDARKGRVYCGYRHNQWAPSDISPQAAILSAPTGFVATGEGALVYEDLILQAGGVVVTQADHPAVGTLARLGRIKLEQGLANERVLPQYIRPPDAVPPRSVRNRTQGKK